MKKTLISIIAIILCIPVMVSAASYSVDKYDIEIEVGASETITLTSSDLAGKISIILDNPKLVSLDTHNDYENALFLDSKGSKEQQITVTGKKPGELTLTIRSTDLASYTTEKSYTQDDIVIKIKVTGEEVAEEEKGLFPLVIWLIVIFSIIILGAGGYFLYRKLNRKKLK